MRKMDRQYLKKGTTHFSHTIYVFYLFSCPRGDLLFFVEISQWGTITKT